MTGPPRKSQIIPPKRWHDDYAWIEPAEHSTPCQVYVTDDAPDHVIYGPDGAVVRTVSTRPPFGFNRPRPPA